MTRPNPSVTIQVTERELDYLRQLTGYPNGRFPHLQVKLGDALMAMREAKRVRNRANKLDRTARRLIGDA